MTTTTAQTQIINDLHKYLASGFSSYPLSDWYDTATGKVTCNGKNCQPFRARPTVGGHLALVCSFSPVPVDSRSLTVDPAAYHRGHQFDLECHDKRDRGELADDDDDDGFAAFLCGECVPTGNARRTLPACLGDVPCSSSLVDTLMGSLSDDAFASRHRLSSFDSSHVVYLCFHYYSSLVSHGRYSHLSFRAYPRQPGIHNCSHHTSRSPDAYQEKKS